MLLRSEDYYGPSEIADGLHVTTATVRNWIKSGKLRAARISRKVNRISGKDLLEMLETGAGKGGAQ